MGVVVFANNASSTLAAAITAAQTTIAVQSADAAEYPTPAAGDWFPVTVTDGSANMEIMWCTARSGVTLTVTRAQEGTTAKAFPLGAQVDHRLTKAALEALAPFAALPKMTAVVDSSVDLNTLTAAGYYSRPVMGNNTNGPYPGNASQFTILTITHPNTLYLSQIAYPTWDTAAGIRTRSCNNGVWSAWVTLATTAYVQAQIAAVPVVPFANANNATTDWNNNTPAGWHNVLFSPGSPNHPPVASYFYCLNLHYTAAGAATQIAVPYGQQANIDNSLWYRGIYNGTWTAWRKLANDADLALKVAKAGDTMTGPLTLAHPTLSNSLILNKVAGNIWNLIESQVAGKRRWLLEFGNNAAETGSNAGTNLTIDRYDDAGVIIDVPFSINRANGIVDMPKGSTTLTQPTADNDTSIATTAFVHAADAATPVVPNALNSDALADWNALTTPGWHSKLLLTGCTNHPPASAYFHCLVLMHNGVGNVTQMAVPYGPQASTNGIWLRGCSAGVWGAWQTFARQTAETLNRLINPSFQISQENGDTACVNGDYPADQWAYFTTGVVGGCNRVSGGGTPNGGKCVLITVTTARPTLAASDQFGLYQKIEGIHLADLFWGTANAKQIVARLWVNAPVAGTFTLSIRNGALNRSYLAPITIPTAFAWTKIEVVIPGDTTGTWLTDAGIGMYFTISFAGGTGTHGVAGWQASAASNLATGTNGAAAIGSFYLADCGLYVDPGKTGLAPPWQLPDEAADLLACQRYYQMFYGMWNGAGLSGAQLIAAHIVPTPARYGSSVSAINGAGTLFPASGTLSFIAGGTGGNWTVRDARLCSGTTYAMMSATYIVNGRP